MGQQVTEAVPVEAVDLAALLMEFEELLGLRVASFGTIEKAMASIGREMDAKQPYQDEDGKPYLGLLEALSECCEASATHFLQAALDLDSAHLAGVVIGLPFPITEAAPP